MSSVVGAISEATGLKPDDWVIASAAIMTAKGKAAMYLGALLEASTPEIRQLFQTHMLGAIAEEQRISGLVAKRGWYKAHVSAEEQVSHAVKAAKAILQ